MTGSDRPRAWNSTLRAREHPMKRAPFQSRPREGQVIELRRAPVRTAATQTGFTRAVKLAVRTRAGNGDPDEALCEACGVWLGRYDGQVQHRLARGSGGNTDPVVASLANAALLCGTPFDGCHGRCEARDRAMRDDAAGFWIRSGKGPDFDPRYVPILLGSGGGSGVRVWLSDSRPEYLTCDPRTAGAA